MAFTPSKDQRRRDREQKKIDKRFARETAKIEKLEAEKAAKEAAALEAFYKTEEGIKAKEEADFEAELAAEAAAKGKIWENWYEYIRNGSMIATQRACKKGAHTN